MQRPLAFVAVALVAALDDCAGVAQAARRSRFEWKKLTIAVGSTPSGGYDQYGRLLARHIGRHLPGHPR